MQHQSLLLLLFCIAHGAAAGNSCDATSAESSLASSWMQQSAGVKLAHEDKSLGSCAEYGCVGYRWKNACQCNERCSRFRNCCDDYDSVCAAPTTTTTTPPPGSCAEYSCVGYTPENACQCNDRCSQFHNCCADYGSICVAPTTTTTTTPKPPPASCEEYGCVGYTPENACQCNDRCSKFSNCCADYESICVAPTTTTTTSSTPPPASCAEHGCIPYTPENPCQCNDLCSHYNNCCADYASICAERTVTTLTTTTLPPSNTSQAFWQGVNLTSAAAVRLKLASTHNRVSYSDIWSAYKTVWVNLPLDLPAQCQDKIFEVYSDKCWTPGVEQCGQYKKEGDCYNREHSWPKSWWGGQKNDAYSDLFHVYPSDGFVNSKRSNYPYGNVDSPRYTSSDGSKLGHCSVPGFNGTCFEPSGKHKGNLARGHFYIALRYSNEFTCCDKEGVDGAQIKPWLTRLLLQWHQEDPVEMWEQEFNSRVEALQGNRNPFIDFPSLVEFFFS